MDKKLIKIETTKDKKMLDIRWDPSNVCNFKCRYCEPINHNGIFKSPNDLDLIVDNFSHILDQYKNKLNKEKFRLTMAGGEPTLWKDLSTFISKIKDKNDVYVSIVSNGSRTLRWWIKNGHLIDNLTLSLHVKEADISHSIAVADLMHGLGVKTTVKVMMDPLDWDNCVNAVETMKTKSNKRWFIIVAKIIGFEEYTTEQLDYLKDSLKRMPSISWFWKNRKLMLDGLMTKYESVATFDNLSKINATSFMYVNENLNYFKGWKCNLGIENIYISYSGELQGSCSQKLYNGNMNILDRDFIKNFNLDINPVNCEQLRCECIPETHITKFIK